MNISRENYSKAWDKYFLWGDPTSVGAFFSTWFCINDEQLMQTTELDGVDRLMEKYLV